LGKRRTVIAGRSNGRARKKSIEERSRSVPAARRTRGAAGSEGPLGGVDGEAGGRWGGAEAGLDWSAAGAAHHRPGRLGGRAGEDECVFVGRRKGAFFIFLFKKNKILKIYVE